MSAIDNPTVAPGPPHIETEQDAGLGGEHRSPAGGGVPGVVEAIIKQAINTVKDAVPEAETPANGDQALAETNSYFVDGSSSADDSSDTVVNETDDRLSEKEGKGADYDLVGDLDDGSDDDSDDDSDSDSGDDFWARFQPRGEGVYGYTGKGAPPGSGLKPSKSSDAQSTAQSKSQAQKPTKADSKSNKTDNKSSKAGKSSQRDK